MRAQPLDTKNKLADHDPMIGMNMLNPRRTSTQLGLVAVLATFQYCGHSMENNDASAPGMDSSTDFESIDMQSSGVGDMDEIGDDDLPTSGASGMQVTVSGNKILIDGNVSTLKGFTFVGRLNPTTCAPAQFATAWASWSASELMAARDTFHANTVRMQVAQSILYDSTGMLDPSITSEYLKNVVDAVALIRSLGMVAEVSMQWEHSGTYICDSQGHDGATLSGVPDVNTDNAWKALLTDSEWTHNTSNGTTAQNFLTDKGVVLEMYNEPTIGNGCGSATAWSQWQTNMQVRLNAIRALGAMNSIIVPALNKDTLLDATSVGGDSLASHLLTDSLQALLYAVHPYPYPSFGTGDCHKGDFSAQDWNRWWGGLAMTLPAPIFVSEWYTGSQGDLNATGSFCWDKSRQPSPSPPGYTAPTHFSSDTISAQFTAWLATAGPSGGAMSLSGAWPFDVAGFIVQDLSSYAPTFYDANFACLGKAQGVNGLSYEGPGALLQAYFATH